MLDFRKQFYKTFTAVINSLLVNIFHFRLINNICGQGYGVPIYSEVQ